MTAQRLDVFGVAELVKLDTEQAVLLLLKRAAELHASDLFFLCDRHYVTVAMRRLGTTQRIAVVSTEQGRQMIIHVKAVSGMDITERRRPADGRWIQAVGDRTIDMRINCTPTLHGEDLTLRLWDHSMGLRKLDELGMTRDDYNTLLFMLNEPSGLILVTGPTGTGKTTTLYACLQHLNDGTRKINALEDPIEYELDGVRQSQVNSRVGLDFSELLRNILRQAPDVIMIGEIRDEDTAETAVRASHSGHLVLATLHAPTASGAIQSMLALGVHRYFFSGCLLGVVAQRLIRTLCPACRVEYDLTEAPQAFDEVRGLLGPDEGRAIYGPSGCDACFGVGYKGRTGLFEIFMVNQQLRRRIAESATTSEIEKSAVDAGMVVFRRGALLKVARGETSTEEILRDVPAGHLGIED